MSNDPVLDGFLRQQREQGMELASASDLLELTPIGNRVPTHYLARFHTNGLVSEDRAKPEPASGFLLGIQFHAGYLRYADPARVLSWLAPRTVFHPNIRTPLICIGPIAPGTGLVELLYRVFDVITYHNVTPNEYDALDAVACAWARRNRHLFPIDRRPLKRLPR